MLARHALVLVLSLFVLQQATAQTIYVDQHASGGGNGLGWATAYQSLDAALAQAQQLLPNPTEIRIAAGNYLPTVLTEPENPASARFTLRGNVSLRGGYAGVANPQPDLRDINVFATILSGDLLANDGPSFANYADNAQFILGVNADATGAELDGLNIDSGRGALCIIGGHVAMTDCKLTKHEIIGAGYALLNRNGELSMTRCRVTDCGNWDGDILYGAIRCEGTGKTRIENCIIANNAGGFGSAINNEAPSSVICTNSLIVNNFGYYSAIVNTGTMTLTNCAVVLNSRTKILSMVGQDAGGFSTYDGSTNITNCIFWKNRNDDGVSQESQIKLQLAPSVQFNINHSCIQGWNGSLGGVGNFGDDPLFVDADGPDNILNTFDDVYRLSDGSPCLDVGDNFADTDSATPGIQNVPRTDLNGAPRIGPIVQVASSINVPVIDIGPYEGGDATIEVSQVEIQVPDSGKSSFDVWLSRPPRAPVTVNVAALTAAPITVDSGAVLKFDPGNYKIPRTVTLRAAADAGFIHDQVTIRLSATSYASTDVIAIQIDADKTPAIIYVKPNATGLGTGTDWANAFTSLQFALDIAESHERIESIFVAAGYYLPSKKLVSFSPHSVTFNLPPGISLYGGFAGTESSPDQRDLAKNVSTLCGDLLDNDQGDFEDASRAENSYSVVTIKNVQVATRIDGFRITGGNAVKKDPQNNGKIGAGLRIVNSVAVIANCLFEANHAVDGGAAVASVDGSNVQVFDSEFRNNLAYSNVDSPRGGAVVNEHADISFERCRFVDNEALGDSPYAGAIYSLFGHLILIKTDFVGNSATNDTDYSGGFGGAILCTEGGLAASSCNFTDNYASFEGGAVYIDADEPLSIVDCSFIENTAEEYGGALSLSHCMQITIENCMFTGNRLQGDLSPNAAAIIASYSPVQIVGCEFIDNRATSIWSNSGAVALSLSSGARGLVKDCHFENNYGARFGVGVIRGFNLEHCTLINNLGREAGAITAKESDIINCRFSGNRCIGGSLHTGKGTIQLLGDASMVGCLVSGNAAPTVGGVYCASANAIELTNCSIYGNTTTVPAPNGPGGILFTGNHPRVANCIVAHHAIDIAGSGAVIRESCIQILPPEYAGNNNFSADPQFIDRGGLDNILGTIDDDPSIAATSPCLNAGDNEAPLLPEDDLFGNPRIQTCRVDIGAAESDALVLNDCNNNGIHDDCEILEGSVIDCNHNYIPDTCEIAEGIAADVNQNGIPDSCEYLVLRVNASAPDDGDGSSWPSALNDLQQALAMASQHDGTVEIWVAAGVYHPSLNNNPDDSFHVPSHVTLFGGFAGDESDASQRDFVTNETILSGDNASGVPLDGCCDSNPQTGCANSPCREYVCSLRPSCCSVGWDSTCNALARSSGANEYCGPCTINEDNSYSVVDMSNTTDSTIIDGFTIRDSIASYGHNSGGIFISDGSPVIRNCKLNQNGGVGLSLERSSPIIEKCQLSWNTGGARLDLGSSAIFEHCRFEQNQGSGLGLDNASTVTIRSCEFRSGLYGITMNQSGLFATNCVFTNLGMGGANRTIWLSYASQANLNYCTITHNQSVGVHLDDGSRLAATNCIFWGNSGSGNDVETWQIERYSGALYDVRNSCIQGLNTLAGFGNVGESPQFVNEAAGDFHLLPTSPCADAGSMASSPEPLLEDLDGNPRFSGCEVDMGAYEITAGVPASGDLNSDGIVSFDDISIAIQLLLTPSPMGNCVGDLDNSGQFDGGDIQHFIDLILQ